MNRSRSGVYQSCKNSSLHGDIGSIASSVISPESSWKIKGVYNVLPSLIILIYAGVVAIVGISGFVLKGSVISMVAGLASGAILAWAGRAVAQRQAWGFPVAVVVTLLLLARFASGYNRLHEMWPNGFMAIVSALALVAIVISGRNRNAV